MMMLSEREEVLKGLRRAYDLAWAMTQTLTATSALRKNLAIIQEHTRKAMDYLSRIGGLKDATLKDDDDPPNNYSTTDVSELLEVLKEDTRRRTAGRELAELILNPSDHHPGWWSKTQLLAQTALGIPSRK